MSTKTARSKSASRAARWPLRRVVDQEYDDAADRILEHLECGHVTPQRCDSMGPTNAYRRRCYKCPERDPDA